VRILITGVAGFVGGHLWRHLLKITPDAEIHGTAIEPQTQIPETIRVHTSLDLKDGHQVRQLLAVVQPHQIYHLAAQSSPRISLEGGAAWATLETNIKSQLNLIEACLSLDIAPRMLVISSGDIYGHLPVSDEPIDEDTPLRPRNPYAVSKATQDLLGLQYYLTNQLPVIRVRPFNHTGPGQSLGFVAPDYASRIASMEVEQSEPVLVVKNPASQRDFSDVRDVVRAYQLVMAKGIPGEVYNIASGKAYSVHFLVETLLSYTDAPIHVEYEEANKNDRGVPVYKVDTTHLRHTTGWQPEIPFEETLLDVLNDWRQRARVSAQS
jgi:GDP-4-dehydro-6-deoxy-D-mannose reductase